MKEAKFFNLNDVSDSEILAVSDKYATRSFAGTIDPAFDPMDAQTHAALAMAVSLEKAGVEFDFGKIGAHNVTDEKFDDLVYAGLKDGGYYGLFLITEGHDTILADGEKYPEQVVEKDPFDFPRLYLCELV